MLLNNALFPSNCPLGAAKLRPSAPAKRRWGRHPGPPGTSDAASGVVQAAGRPAEGSPEAFGTIDVRHQIPLLRRPVVLDKITNLGEGRKRKTLVSTMPAYLNSLTGEGVHLVTVNDYLAKRDSEWMGGVFRQLGVSVGLIQSQMTPQERRPAYAADITYGTNNEFGFDYLRDNMAFSKEEKVQRDLNFAIVDEVDSILIDEARTPLIISGPAEESSELYRKINNIIPLLKKQEQ